MWRKTTAVPMKRIIRKKDRLHNQIVMKQARLVAAHHRLTRDHKSFKIPIVLRNRKADRRDVPEVIHTLAMTDPTIVGKVVVSIRVTVVPRILRHGAVAGAGRVEKDPIPVKAGRPVEEVTMTTKTTVAPIDRGLPEQQVVLLDLIPERNDRIPLVPPVVDGPIPLVLLGADARIHLELAAVVGLKKAMISPLIPVTVDPLILGKMVPIRYRSTASTQGPAGDHRTILEVARDLIQDILAKLVRFRYHSTAIIRDPAGDHRTILVPGRRMTTKSGRFLVEVERDLTPVIAGLPAEVLQGIVVPLRAEAEAAIVARLGDADLVRVVRPKAVGGVTIPHILPKAQGWVHWVATWRKKAKKKENTRSSFTILLLAV